MPCFTLLLALLSPRIALVWVALTTDLPSEATGSVLVPLLGFFLLPWTTLVYILMCRWAPTRWPGWSGGSCSSHSWPIWACGAAAPASAGSGRRSLTPTASRSAAR